jgi:hypothetical protein
MKWYSEAHRWPLLKDVFPILKVHVWAVSLKFKSWINICHYISLLINPHSYLIPVYNNLVPQYHLNPVHDNLAPQYYLNLVHDNMVPWARSRTKGQKMTGSPNSQTGSWTGSLHRRTEWGGHGLPKISPGPPWPTLLRSAGGPPPKRPMAVLGVVRPQDGWPVAVFYPLGCPTPYGPAMRRFGSLSSKSEVT